MIFDVSLALPSFFVSLLISYSSIENSSLLSLFTFPIGKDELRQYSSIENGESVHRQYSSVENKEYDDKQYSSIENGESSLMA